MKLPIDGLPGWSRVALDTVGSTNAEALEWFANGDTGRLWVTALEQTNGKGRRGRDWHSPVGNLYASALLVDPAPPEKLSGLPLLAAVTLHEALSSTVARDSELKIKWPNDVLLRDGKVAGILLEAGMRAGQQGVVTGFGVNCSSAPDEGLYATASLSKSEDPVSVDRVFDALAASLNRWLDRWDSGGGFGKIRDYWLQHAVGLNEHIIARFANHEVAGTFRDIDQAGFLILERPDGTVEQISAADIFFGNSVTEGT